MSERSNASQVAKCEGPRQPESPSEISWLRGILLAAAAARIGTVAVLHNFFNPNFFEWGDISRKYLAGRGFSYYAVNGVDVPTAYMPPAYSFLVQAMFVIFGDRPLAYVLLQLIQASAGVVLVYLVYRLTRLVWDTGCALLAAAIAAVYPPFLYIPSEMHPISLYIVITLAVVYFLFLYLDQFPRIAHAIFAGLLLGVLIYFRAEALALPFLFSVVLVSKSRQYWPAALLVLVLPMLLAAPWAYRNYRTLGSLIATTTAGGVNLWYGHNPQATGTQREMWPSGKVVTPDPALQKRLEALPASADYELRRSAVFRDEALQFMRAHRQREVELTLRKFFYFWTIDWNHPKARHAAYFLPTLVMVALFWLGVFVNREQMFGRLLLLTVTVAFTNLTALVFFVLPRYRLAVEPIMIPFAASALVWAWRVWADDRKRSAVESSDVATQSDDSVGSRTTDVVVVTFNSARDIHNCVTSILLDGAKPIVVDNGSTDTTLDILAREFPQVQVLLNPDNGYARAANIGIASASGEHVILSNADVVYPPGSIARLVEYLDSHPQIGALGPQQVFPDGSWQRSWGRVTGTREALFELCGITTAANALRRVLWPRRLNRTALKVGYVDGAVMTIRRSAYDFIAGFDERFCFSAEETDFCVRLRRAGWQVVALPTVDVVHRRGGSSSRLDWTTERCAVVMLEGTRTFLQKHRGPRFTKFYFGIKRISSWNLMVLCEIGSRIAPSSVRCLLDEKARIHRAYFNHLRNGARSVPVSTVL